MLSGPSSSSCSEDQQTSVYTVYSQISDTKVVFSNEGLLGLNDLVDTSVGMEGSLDVIENSDGTVSSSSTISRQSDK